MDYPLTSSILLCSHDSGPTDVLIFAYLPYNPIYTLQGGTYLCVTPDSLRGVLCPARNISQPAWAIMAPLSMQNLGRKKRYEIWGLKVENYSNWRKKSRKDKDLYLSSVAKSRAPRSWHIVSIISCSLILPMMRWWVGLT